MIVSTTAICSEQGAVISMFIKKVVVCLGELVAVFVGTELRAILNKIA